jgi:hypothetical protein
MRLGIQIPHRVAINCSKSSVDSTWESLSGNRCPGREGIRRGSFRRTSPRNSRFRSKHLRGFSGTQGMLKISDEYILHKTAVPKDSRIWRYQDISSVGTTGPYQMRLTSMDRAENESGSERNFVFSLKERLAPEAYDFIWWKINGPQISAFPRK